MSDKTLPRLQARYREEIVPTLMEDFGYKNINQVPTIKKVVVNIGMGEANENPKLMDGAVETLRTITGQQLTDLMESMNVVWMSQMKHQGFRQAAAEHDAAAANHK